MNLALAGLPAREEVALGMLVGRSLAGWQCSAAPAGLDAALPPAELYVVDLAGRGLARWTEAAQADLLNALNGMPAVLVAPAFDRSWAALDAARMTSQPLVLLHKPYGTEDMLAALRQAAAGHASPLPAALPVKPPAPAAKRRAPSALAAAHQAPLPTPARVPVSAVAPAARAVPARLSVQAQVPPSPAPAPVLHATAAPVAIRKAGKAVAPVPAVAAPQAQGEITLGEFQVHLDALPRSGMRLFLQRLAQALALHQPFEVRLNTLNRWIADPDAQWVAGNTSSAGLARLLQDEAFASALEFDAIDARDAPGRAQRLDLPRQPMALFLWQLAHERLAGSA
ncbi:MAG: hypothetical protein JWR60_3256 [Polaromonas sp.]|nr:hypothetical protein [Polaromonas sp.]